MLVLGNDALTDDDDPTIRYRLPQALAPVRDAEGLARVSLSRGPEGGGLSLHLQATWPELAAHERRVRFARGRFRLGLRSPGGDPQSGRWREAMLSEGAVLAAGIRFDPVETAIARRLAPQGAEVVEVEAELTYLGRLPSFPWIVRVPGSTLRDQLVALLADDGDTHDWATVERAFTGLSMDVMTWHPREPGALPPPPEAALRALAHHAAPLVLARDGDAWVVADEVPNQVAIDLAVARTAHRSEGLRWSFSQFLAGEPDPSAYLVEHGDLAPFKPAKLQVINDVPLHASGISSIAITVKTGGPTGVVGHEFRPGAPSVAQLEFILETYEALQLQWRPRVVLMTPRGPATVARDFRPCDLTLHIDSAAIGFTPLRLAADPTLFTLVDALAITLGRGTIELTASEPERWVVVGEPPPTVDVVAVLTDPDDDRDDAAESEARRVRLGTLPLGPRGLTIGPAELGVGEPAEVTLRPPADLSTRAAYLAVQIEDGPWRSLDADGSVSWTVRRPTKLHVPTLRYRTRIVPRGTDGKTQPMTDSSWHQGRGEAVEVEV